MDKVTVLGSVCIILVKPGNDPWNCCLVKMVRRTAAVTETVCCTTIWIWLQSMSIKVFITVFIIVRVWSVMCNLIHIVVHNTVPGIDALLGNMLTEQSRGPLPRFTRMLHTVPKTVILFIWWCTTQSLGLLPFFKPYWPNSPGDLYQCLREFHIQSQRL